MKLFNQNNKHQDTFLAYFHSCGMPGIIVDSSDFIITDINTEANELINDANIEFKGQPIHILLPALENNKPADFNKKQLLVETPAGKSLFVQLHASEIELNKKVVHILFFVTIQPNKYKPNETKKLLEIAISAANQQFWTIDTQTHQMKIIGNAIPIPTELANKTVLFYNDWLSYIHKEDRKKTERQFLRFLEGKIPFYQVEYRFQTNNGEYIWILSTGQLNSKENEAMENLISGSHLNINHLRNMENELLDKTKEIEAQNIKLKKYNSELIQAKEKAEENDKLKTAFLQNMSHELRTPMNGIFGFTQLMNIPNLSEEKRKHYLSLINESTHQLLRIVSDIMDISKIETQQLRIHNKNININELLQNIFDFNKVQAESKGLSLELIKDLPNSIATFDADEDKIKTTFNNLISNSIKYTEEGFIQFGYNYTNNKLTFFVKDSGIGISPELHDYIFQRFSQAHPDDATKKYGGNGLGLAICKGITELLGGKIWVESQKGNGATFFFHLPLKQVSLTKKHIGHNIHNVNILIVEDEDNNFLYLQEILDKEPYNLSRALNGKEAVEMALKTDFQIILMDLAMPIMDGYTAIKAIKKERPAIYIIAQTAYAMKDDKEKAFSAGCDDYITKPVNGVILKRLLRNSISSKTSKQ